MLQHQEKDNELINQMIQNEDFSKIISYLDNQLPIKRVYEYAILKELMNTKSLTLSELFGQMKKYVNSPDNNSYKHAVQNLYFKFASKTDKNKYIKLISLDNSMIRLSEDFYKVLNVISFSDVIKDTISYGLARYHHEFDRVEAPFPNVQLYHEYSKADIYTLARFDKNVQGLLMSGVVRIGNEYFLTVNLEKGNVSDSINYHDYFIDQNKFHWQSQNHTTQTNDTGMNLIHHEARGINLHMFVRKSATEGTDNKGYSRNFTYLGKVFMDKYNGEAPISFELKFEHRVPNDIYQRLTYDYTKEKDNEKTN